MTSRPTQSPESTESTESERQRADDEYDVIVIGSGMGGLATASILAQVGRKRVLVLESHFKPGGFLHSFQRHGYTWDPGVHYIGDMGEGSLTRRCMDLVTGGRVSWHKLDDSFERFVFPGEQITTPSDPAAYQAKLIERFPGEADNIRRYFRDLKKVQRWSYRWFWSKQFSEPMASVVAAGRRLATTGTGAYLERFRDPLLRAVLAGQWPDYGVPPGRSAFGVHAIVAADFGHGGYYPVGGSKRLVDGAIAKIEASGGRCLVRHRVDEILIEGGRVRGVTVTTRDRTRTFRAPQVVSGAGVHTTFTRLVDDRHAKRERSRAIRATPGPSATILFLGLNDDPRNHGFADANYWVYDHLDHDLEVEGDFPPPVLGAFLSFGSLRDPSQSTHTAQIITFSKRADWDAFADRPWRKRSEAYEDLKEQVAENMLAFIDQRVPGLRPLVDHAELASPLTVESMTGHPGGEIYGRPSDPDRMARDQWSIGTSVRRLYLTGTDLVVPGVNSALMIGVMTAAKVLGPGGTPRVFHAAGSVKPDAPASLSLVG